MATEETTATINDEDLYEAATAPEATPEEPPKEEGRARDEKGRFAAKEEEETQEPEPVEAAEPVAEEPVKEKVDHRIPLTELLNEREKRQAEQRRAEAALQELQMLRQQMQRPAQPIPDQFADPQAYNQYWESKMQEMNAQWEQRFREATANTSLQNAHVRHGELFVQAYESLIKTAESGDRGPAQQIVNSPDPGEAMVRWYKRERTLQQVGDDPNAFVEKVQEELLKNPEFLARAVEAARGVATKQPTQVKIPPSLNKATSSASATGKASMSDADLYHYAIGR